jgi:hypothetical protein
MQGATVSAIALLPCEGRYHCVTVLGRTVQCVKPLGSIAMAGREWVLRAFPPLYRAGSRCWGAAVFQTLCR